MLRISLVLLLLTSLSGCAYLHSLSSDLPDQVDTWIAKKEYGKALNTLNYIDSKHPSYALLMQKRKKIQQLVRKFEKDTQAEALRYEKENKWNKANLLYIDAINKLPKSTALESGYQEFLKRRENYLQELEIKLNLSRGTWLSNNLSLHKRIYEANPEDDFAKQRYLKNSEEQQAVIQGLINCSNIAISNGRNRMAETCLQIALSLNAQNSENKKEFNTQLVAIKSKLSNKQNIITRKLINELKQGYSHDNLKRAYKHLSTLNAGYNDKTSKQLTAELRKYFNAGVAQRMEAGRKLYTTGKIKSALAIWEPLAEIAPDNAKLKSHIARSKRVLANINKLKRQSQPTNNKSRTH